MTSIPLIRFWSGYASPALSDVELGTALTKVLVPKTIEIGAGHGLLAYTPTVLTRIQQETSVSEALPEGSRFPDETALVIYRDTASYDAIRATPAGKLYGPLHFKLNGVKDIPGMESLEGRDFFVQDDGQGHKSGSAVATNDLGHINFGNAYAPVIGTEAMWQSASVMFKTYARKPGISDEQYLNSIATYLRASARGETQLQWHIVRVEQNYIMEYWGMSHDLGYGGPSKLHAAILESSLAEVGINPSLLDPLTGSQSLEGNHTFGRGSGYKLLFDQNPA